MRKNFVLFSFIVVGLLLIIASWSSQTFAQGDDEKEYYGARECLGCHRDVARDHEETSHALALIDTSDDEFIVADFDAIDTIAADLPSENVAGLFNLDTISYALGSGDYVQRFVYENEDGAYVVLPAEWHSASETWELYGPVESWPDDPKYDFGFSCAYCHTTGYDAEAVDWVDEGVQCEACHGPGSIHVETADEFGRPNDEELVQIRDAIVASPDARICGQCHVQGTEPVGNHPFPTAYNVGDELLDEDIFVAVDQDDEVHWWASGHARGMNMQFNEWLAGAHSNSLNTLRESEFADDRCLQCHSADYSFTEKLIALHDDGDRDGEPPDLPTLDEAQFSVTCTVCHNPHGDPEQTGAMLTAEDSYSQCVSCHGGSEVIGALHEPVQQMFEGQTILDDEGEPMLGEVEAVASAHFTEENGPTCTTCHMSRVPVSDGTTRASHFHNPLEPGVANNIDGLEDACTGCHGEQVQSLGLQGFIDTVQSTTLDRIETINAALDGSEPEWVRSAVTFVEHDGSLGIHNHAYTNNLLNAVEIEIGLQAEQDTEVDEGVLPDMDVNKTPRSDARFNEDEVDEGVAPGAFAIMALSILLLIGGLWMIFVRREPNDA